ncbi:alpha-galactosidase [Marinomonas balearica]|uniref:Alpha-galactosidase n=2 Tax=Marinomonas balearica TaxID=491947 RepID=A0A4V3CG00_9GAMM|nr:alpha-galactosidase [Marinomonas balearica]
MNYVRQDCAGKTLILALPDQGAPELLYFGEELPAHTNIESVYLVLSSALPNSSLNEPYRLSLIPEAGRGWMATPGVEVFSNELAAWSLAWEVHTVNENVAGFAIRLEDRHAELELIFQIGIKESGVLGLSLELINTGREPVQVVRLASTFPCLSNFTQKMSFYGRWCQEFQHQTSQWNDTWIQESRYGRSGHENFPGVVLGESNFSEQTGEVVGAHLAWSGNHSLRADVAMTGERYLQAGALYLPGEEVLHTGESTKTPELLIAHSCQGLNGVSQQFHREARARTKLTKPRPVHINTWEAFYFDHDLEQLCLLASRAAEVGVERYILDDGWFKGRNDDTSALGDWYVDEQKYPNGLTPLIDHVKSLGMEFGLWVEPEMVNPDSALYRAHPDWVLELPAKEHLLFRNQLVLNLANPDAYVAIRGRLFDLLNHYDIDYIKWDMNRDYVSPSGDIHPQALAQVTALYRLLGELNDAFPELEIESCASGGARVDFGILNYTKRFWTSDCNDALERQTIQRGFSYFFPPEVMGAHIGPDKSHTTSRIHDVVFRAGTAIQGHLGIEWNLLQATDEQKSNIADWIECYKAHRELMHSANLYRLPSVDGCAQTQWYLNDEKTEGLAIYSQLAMPKRVHPDRLRLPALEALSLYRVEVIAHSPMPSHLMQQKPAWWQQKIQLNGASLERVGIQLPVMDPESVLLLRVSVADV